MFTQKFLDGNGFSWGHVGSQTTDPDSITAVVMPSGQHRGRLLRAAIGGSI